RLLPCARVDPCPAQSTTAPGGAVASAFHRRTPRFRLDRKPLLSPVKFQHLRRSGTDGRSWNVLHPVTSSFWQPEVSCIHSRLQSRESITIQCCLLGFGHTTRLRTKGSPIGSLVLPRILRV